MRYFFVLLLLLAINPAMTQDFIITSTETLPAASDEMFYFPRFTPDGNQLLLTRNNLQGLWIYELQNKRLTQLNNHAGAGYQPTFIPNRDEVVYRSYIYQGPKKYYSLHVQDMQSRKDEILVANLRRLHTPVQLLNSVAYLTDGLLQVVRPEKGGGFLKSNAIMGNEKIAMVADQRIVIFENGQKKELKPFGRASYIWLSLSPDQQRILFTLGTKGTFIADLDGNILVELGLGVNAPRWSPDGQWILYMRDEDDGHTQTASDIFVVSSNGQNEQQLTRTQDKIEMYPEWAPDGGRITYHSVDGSISLMSLQMK